MKRKESPHLPHSFPLQKKKKRKKRERRTFKYLLNFTGSIFFLFVKSLALFNSNKQQIWPTNGDGACSPRRVISSVLERLFAGKRAANLAQTFLGTFEWDFPASTGLAKIFRAFKFRSRIHLNGEGVIGTKAFSSHMYVCI